MWRKFRWDMFVTSFIPLWVSIIVFNVWKIVENSIGAWNKKSKYVENIVNCLEKSGVELCVTLVVILLVLISVRGINSFIKQLKSTTNNPKGTIIRATKANKLSSEFLLAYILPMIAFDFGEIKDIVLFVIYFSVLAFLCIRNNNIYTNILLEFKGYKMYNCDIECSVLENKKIYHDSLIISEDDLTQMEENEITYWDFDKYIYIAINEVEDSE